MIRLNKGVASFAVAMAFAVGFSSCGGEKKSSAAASSSSNTAVNVEKAVEKPAQITWMVHDGLKKENGTDQWAAEFTKLTGIKMNLNIVSNNEYSQLLDLAFASGETPDVFDLAGDRFAAFVKQGAVADLTDYIKNSELSTTIDKSIWDSIAINGHYYGIPKEMPNGVVTYVRQDFLDRLGMKQPETYDEFITMLRRFRDEIPECTVPLTAPGVFEDQYLREFYQDAKPDFVKGKDGKWVDGMAQDNMAQALQRLQDAYKEGLIDMEVVTNKTSTCRDEWYSGKVGVFAYWAGTWCDTLSNRIKANIPTASVSSLKAIKESYYYRVMPSVWCIPSSRNPEKVAQIFKYFMEYKNDGGEGQVLFQSGVQDLHWKQEGDHLVPLPTIPNPKEVQLKAFVDPALSVTPLKVTDKKLDHSAEFLKSYDDLNANYVQIPILPVSRKYTKVSSDLKLLRQEVLSKVVMGVMSVEDGMKKYRTDSEALGVADILKEFNE